MILGPADPDHYRVKVGRYGDRWYTDPLPACDIADATTDVWPSVSTIKKASGNDWTFVGLKRVAQSRTSVVGMGDLDEMQRYDTLKSINQHGLKVAAGRGTIVHWWGEDLLHGKQPRTVTELDLMAHKIPAASLEEAQRYLPALQQFFDQYQPELVATEYPVINRTLNGVGYGCTPDGLLKIGEYIHPYDFKTRSADSDHGAYPEEAAQIAAGVYGDYMIAEGPEGPIRRQYLPMDDGIIISIKPEGCRIYPVNIEQAYEHFMALHSWWVARRTEREPIGKPWAPRKVTTSTTASTLPTTESPSTTTATPASPSSTQNAPPPSTPSSKPSSTNSEKASNNPQKDSVHTRAKLLVDAGHGLALANLWPENVPGLKGDHQHTPVELDAIRVAIRQIEDMHDMPWHEDDAPPPGPATIWQLRDNAYPVTPQPDEGPLVDDNTYQALKRRYDQLLPENKDILERITREATDAGHDLSLRRLQSVRRFEIARALIFWCETGWDDDVMADLLVFVTDRVPDLTKLGAIIGTLSIDQAKQLADMAETALEGFATLTHTDNRWTLVPKQEKETA
jgi:hypothetical protein